MCVTCVYKSYGRKTTRLRVFFFLRFNGAFFNHTDNLDSSEESEVENSKKRKGNEHLQERYLSMKWIG